MTEPNLRRRLNLRRLPPEIVEEILCNLPVKSLNRFRCVSSHWQSLISDNQFIRKHLIRGLTSSQRTRLIVNDIETCHTNDLLYWSPLPSSSDFIDDTRENEDPCPLPISSLLNMSQQQRWPPWVLASCDGLLCVRVFRQIYVLNPFMKTFRLIDSCSSKFCFFALGYDSIRDDYKLIKISRNDTLSSSRIETWVYSLKNSSWTRADDFPRLDFFPSKWSARDYLQPTSYTFLNGRIYWLSISFGVKKCAFVSFDLSENKYIDMPVNNLPIWECSHEDVKTVKLFVLRGMFCVCFDNRETDCLDLWVMKDCRDENSWSRILSVPFQLIFFKYDNTWMGHEVLYLYENGEVLLGVDSWHGSEMLICKDSRILSRKITYSYPRYIQEGFTHVESLISP